MFVTGHVAAALLASRRWDLDARVVVAATLFPDVVDKTARYVLHAVPSGRLPSHTLLALSLTAGAAYLLGSRAGLAGPWARAWVVGFVLHLICDFASPVPLLWPFFSYDFQTHSLAYVLWHPPTPVEVASLILEGVLVGLAIYVEWRRCRHGKLSIVPRC
jgi:hypothetical protein